MAAAVLGALLILFIVATLVSIAIFKGFTNKEFRKEFLACGLCTTSDSHTSNEKEKSEGETPVVTAYAVQEGDPPMAQPV